MCSFCKRPDAPHVKSRESERTIPLLVGDYGFVKDGVDDENVTVLVSKLCPLKIFLCLRCGEQGIGPIGGRKG